MQDIVNPITACFKSHVLAPRDGSIFFPTWLGTDQEHIINEV